jgi:hypothetical protein
MSPHDWWAMLSAEDGTYHEVRFRYTGDDDVDQRNVRMFIPVGEARRFVRMIDQPDEDCSVALVPRKPPLPEGMRPAEWVGKSTVLWARLDNNRQMNVMRNFNPVPTVVVRHGASVHRLAIWWLSTPLNVVQLERANRRIAHALGAKKKFADATQHVFVPGTVLRNAAPGRKAVAVHVEYESGGRYTLGQVVGHLPDAPDPDAWRDQ